VATPRPLLSSVFFLLAGACSGWSPALAPPMEADLADWYDDGMYRGMFYLDTRARAGGVSLKRAACINDITIKVNSRRDTIVDGTVACNMGADVGVLSIDLTSVYVEAPTIVGNMDANDTNGLWQGWFLADGGIYGETVGASDTDMGVVVDYWGWFDVQYDHALRQDGGKTATAENGNLPVHQ
jgi:hypothetical protein